MEEEQFSLLLVDDEPDILSSLKRVFRKKDYTLHTASDGIEALHIVDAHRVDAAVIDLKMPEVGGLELLEEIKKRQSAAEVFILTGVGGVKEAVSALKAGATDFFEKPFRPEHILAHIEHIEKIWNLDRENRRLKDQIDFSVGFDSLIGNSTPMLQLKRFIMQAGRTDSPVLVLGETGTGKELVARAIHKHSNRSGGPFVPVDCAAISEAVMESELFGHVKGAFTGAHTATQGLLRAADGGTVFFDELAELPLHVQSKLLRSIQEGEVRPVGSTKQYPVDARIVAATNRDIEKEVEEHRFREDLYYRLNVIVLRVPPLKDRPEDIPLLVKHFLKQFSGNQEYRMEPAALKAISERPYSWPGNVRELQNLIRRLIAFSPAELITRDQLLEMIDEGTPGAKTSAGTPDVTAAHPDGGSAAADNQAATPAAETSTETANGVVTTSGDLPGTAEAREGTRHETVETTGSPVASPDGSTATSDGPPVTTDNQPAVPKAPAASQDGSPEGPGVAAGPPNTPAAAPEDYSMAAWERAAIQNALEHTVGKRKEAAGLLGISEATLYRKLKEYGL